MAEKTTAKDSAVGSNSELRAFDHANEPKQPSYWSELQNKIGSWMSEWGYDSIAAVISIADVATDIIVMNEYYSRGHLTFFYLSLTIVIIAQLCYCFAFTMRYSRYDDSCAVKIFTFCCVVPIAPLLSFVFFWSSVPNNSLAPWMKNKLGLEVSFYDPSKHPDDSDLRKWVQAKIDKHMGFILEAGIEAFPQSLLQMTALVYYGDGQVSGVAIASILLSLLSVSSKSLVFSQALVPSLFAFNWLCLVNDFICVFTVISWVFAPASDNVSSLLPSSIWMFGSLSTLGQLYLLIFFLTIAPTIIWGSIAAASGVTGELYDDATTDSFRRRPWKEKCHVVSFYWCLGLLGFICCLVLGTVMALTPVMALIALGLHFLNHGRFGSQASVIHNQVFDFLDEAYMKHPIRTKWTRMLSALCCSFEYNGKDEPYLPDDFQGFNTSNINGPEYIQSIMDDNEPYITCAKDMRDLHMRLAIVNLFLSTPRCCAASTMNRNLHHLFFDVRELGIEPHIHLNVYMGKKNEYYSGLSYSKGNASKIPMDRMITVNPQVFDPSSSFQSKISLQRMRLYSSRPKNAFILGAMLDRYFQQLLYKKREVEEIRRNGGNNLRSMQFVHFWFVIQMYLFMPLYLISRLFHWMFPLICLINVLITNNNHNSIHQVWNSKFAFQIALTLFYVSLQCCILILLVYRVAWFHYLTFHIVPGWRYLSMYYVRKHYDRVIQDIRDFHNIVVSRPHYQRLLVEQLGPDIGSVVLEYLPSEFAFHRWAFYRSRMNFTDYQSLLIEKKKMDKEEEKKEEKEDVIQSYLFEVKNV